MRFLRFLVVIFVVALAYRAQAVLHPTGLIASSTFLQQSSSYLPALAWTRTLVVGNVYTLALFGLAFATLTFGLLAAPWPLTERVTAGASLLLWTARTRRRHRVAWSLLLLGLLLGLAAMVVAWVQVLGQPTIIPAEPSPLALRFGLPRPSLPPALVAQVSFWLATAPWLTLALWAASLFCFFLGCLAFPKRVQTPTPDDPPMPGRQSNKSGARWPLFALLLAFAALQVGWRLTDIPRAVNPQVAQAGLAANDWLRTGDLTLFFARPLSLEPGLVSYSQLSLALPALLLALTNDLLVSTRLAGLGAVLLVLTATWLLGTELFRRVPQRIGTELLEDQGQGPALVATCLVLFTTATLLFSRLPVLLEMVGWGSLGCWALLRGWRTHDRLAIGLSGVLIGLSALLYMPGFVFILIALCWWLGFAIVQWGWMPQHLPPPRTGGLLRGQFVVWLLGLGLVAAPQLGVRLLAIGQWLPNWPGNFTNWPALLLAFGQQGDRSSIGGWSIPLLHDFFVPIGILAVGALIFNLDRRVGWLLITWLATGLIYALAIVPLMPSWPALLPILPALGLILAFGLDRLHATLLHSGGAWLRNLLTYLLVGLVAWVGLNNGVDYYHFANQQTDAVSALGYELRALPAGRPIVIVSPPDTPFVASDTPQLRFLTNDWVTPPLANVTFTTTVPIMAAAGTVLLIAPAESTALSAAQAYYPNGSLVIRRDHSANPLFYRYVLPNRP